MFFQAAITPEINAQVEVRSRRSHNGDIEQLWDPDDFSGGNTRDLDQDSFRGGLRWSPTPNSDVLLSMIYSKTNDKEYASDAFFSGVLDQRDEFDDNGYQPEAQYIYRGNQFNVTAGAAYYFVDRQEDIEFKFDGVPLGETSDGYNITDPRGYVYTNVTMPTDVVWTFGLSADSYKEEAIETQAVNPKLGVQWNVTDNVRLRAAAFQVVKAALSTNRTIEPTQVAGFNQFFDDDAGTLSRRYGVGSDWKLADNLMLGAEATWRDLEVPYFAGSNQESHSTDWSEQTHRLYAYWAPADRWALTGQLVYDRFSAQNSDLTEGSDVPKTLTTYSAPLGLRYFDPSGIFAGVGVTFVRQDRNEAQNALTDIGEGESNFALFDAQIGYRLPKRFGIVTLQANNIFDKSFKYQDDSFRESQDSPSTGPFIPERQILLYLTLNW